MQLSMTLFCIRIINMNPKSLLLATVVAAPLGGIWGENNRMVRRFLAPGSRRSPRLYLAVRVCHEQRTASVRRGADVIHRTPEGQHAVFRFTTYLHHKLSKMRGRSSEQDFCPQSPQKPLVTIPAYFQYP